MALLEVRNLRKSYGTKEVLKNLSFKVQEGEIFSLLGENGAGKTTTLDILEGLRQADSGDVLIFGKNINDHKPEIKKRLGVQLQATSLMPDLSVYEQVKLFAELYQLRPSRQWLMGLLERLHLAEKAKARPTTLSGGEKQRLVLALALVNEPDILILDEPSASLDVQSRRLLWSIIKEWHTTSRVVILTTHYIEEAEKLATRVGILDKGSLVALGSPHQLIAELKADSFIWLDTKLPQELLEKLNSADNVVTQDGLVRIYTRNASQTNVELLTLAEKLGIPLGNIRIQHPSLEDVYLAHTGKLFSVEEQGV